MGVLWRCPECGRAALAQFHHAAGSRPPQEAALVLSTFRDFHQDEPAVWSLFGLRAVLPGELTLKRHLFAPGRAELTFQGDGDLIGLWRWGPADVLLKNGDLADFGTRVWSEATGAPAHFGGGRFGDAGMEPPAFFLVGGFAVESREGSGGFASDMETTWDQPYFRRTTAGGGVPTEGGLWIKSVAIMSLFRKKPKSGLTRAEALECVPVKSEAVEEEYLAGGLVRLTYASGIRPWARSLARRLGRPEPAPVPHKLELDELGSMVWGLMDGTRSILGVVEAFAERYQLQPREAEVAVTKFIRDLGRRGLIGLR